MSDEKPIGRLEALKHAAFWSLLAAAFLAIIICQLVRLAFCKEQADVHDT